ncbi:hypothetical protein AAG906_024717 [Vitis piasezkii]
MDGQGKVVCVTGASGYIASWLVKLLLQRGYTVKATVRDPNDPKKTEHLLALEGAKERLHLFKANLLEEGSFDSVVDGCDGVFHTASPVVLIVDDPRFILYWFHSHTAQLIDPALKGTMSVLGSCAKVPSVKRVVVTSSMASVAFNGKPLAPDVLVDESWFSDPVFCEKSKLWYMLSKTLAEEAAWKFAKENGIDMVTINPGWVIGPLLQPTLNLRDTFPNKTHRWVDVRDVAMAHIQAYELSTARGRYCLVGSILHYDKPYEPTYMVSQEKTKSLGIDFTPLEVSMKDTVESLREKNFRLLANKLCKGNVLDYTIYVKGDEWRRKGGVRDRSFWVYSFMAGEAPAPTPLHCQSNHDPKKTQHLLSLDGAQERLHLFKADLLEEGSFDSVVDGCDGVFHTASPVALEAINPQAELIDPALKGTINVLRSYSKVPSVKRVVVTSSLASVLFTGEPLTPEVLIDESWFSDPVICKESKQWYVLSKIAEEAAWKFSKENGIDMVTINPGWVIGAQTFPNISSWWVDVRDVANAHIQAYEIPEANDKPYAPSSRVSQEKAKSLGIHFTPLEVSLKDTVESLKEKNFVSF